jgi:parafibromin
MTFHGISLKSVADGAKPKKLQTLSQLIIPQPKPVAKRISRTPIIIVPSAATSLITMYNATDILQDLR